MAKVSVIYETDDKEFDTVDRLINTLMNLEIPKCKVTSVGLLTDVKGST